MAKHRTKGTRRFPPSKFKWDDLKREIKRQNNEEGRGHTYTEGDSFDSSKFKELQARFRALRDVQSQTRLTPAFKEQQSLYIRDHVNTINGLVQSCACRGEKMLRDQIYPYMVKNGPSQIVRKEIERHHEHVALEECCQVWTTQVGDIRSYDDHVRFEAYQSSRGSGKLDPGFLREFTQFRRVIMLKNNTWLTRARIWAFRGVCLFGFKRR